MKMLQQLRRIMTGSVAGSCIVLLNQTMPMDVTREFYTLEELAYQDTQPKQTSGQTNWSYQWVVDRGFVLMPTGTPCSCGHKAGFRQAVYRTLVNR